jgi:zeaxanthin glucosyltransferase
MRIGFCCPAVPGHIYPFTTLARQLQMRGHEAVFLMPAPEAIPMVEACGVEAVAFSKDLFPPGEFPTKGREFSAMRGEEAIRYVFAWIADVSRRMIEDGERIIVQTKVDCLVLDALWRNLDLVAMKMGVPYVHLSAALHPDVTGQAPYFIYDWPYDPTPEGIARNVRGLKEFWPIVEPCIRVANDYAKRVGLPIDLDDPYAPFSKLAQITQTPREFDFPSDHWPPQFHYAGPFHESKARFPISFPWERLTGEPLIYASMGTMLNGSEQTFRMIIDAASGTDRQLVLSIGQHMDASKIGPMLSNTIVVNQAPQLDVLKKATLCITHAGLNTVLESLAQGVPLVAMPVGNDQPGVAARIAHTQTGVFAPVTHVTAESLRAMVDTVLSDPLYRTNAVRMQKAIHKTDGLRFATDLVEQAFGTRAAVSTGAAM